MDCLLWKKIMGSFFFAYYLIEIHDNVARLQMLHVVIKKYQIVKNLFSEIF